MRKTWSNPDTIGEKPLILVPLKPCHKFVTFLIYRGNEVQLSHGPRINNSHLFCRIQMCAGLQDIETGLVRSQKNQSLSQDRLFLKTLKETFARGRPRQDVLSQQN